MGTARTLSKKKMLAERDGQQCAYCGLRLKDINNYVLEHVVPFSQLGVNALTNRVLACVPCDKAKGGRTPQEWQPGKVFGNPFVDSPCEDRRNPLSLEAERDSV